ncbi:LexA family protein [Guggenheimella bovis]
MKDVIRKNRQMLGLTMKELADKVGVSEATISRWESGEIANMRRSKIASLAKALKISPLEIMGMENANVENRKEVSRIPILGSVRAGVPLEAIKDIIGYVDIDEAVSKKGQHIALKIKGDSMAPKILDGDIVIVRVQSEVESGSVGVIYINGYEATCKKIIYNETSLIIQPLNPSYDPMSFTWDEVEELPIKILGKVIELRRSF